MPKPEIICLGEMLIDFSPVERGEAMLAHPTIRWSAGGAPANVAVGLARLGCPSGFIGKVGADFFGSHLKDLLEKNGVDTTCMTPSTQAGTGLAFVNWKTPTEAEYLFYRNPSADILLDANDIDSDYIAQAKVLHFGSLLLAVEPSQSATYRAMEVAEANGLYLSYDVNFRASVWPDSAVAKAKIAKPLDKVNILKINRSELELLTDENDPPKGSAQLWRDNFKLIVITLDAEGCFYRTANATGTVPSFPVEVVDTVGAGDGFMAGLLKGLWAHDFNFADEKTIQTACRHAVGAGAIAVNRKGAIDSLPTASELVKLIG
jgi:fructokinase